MPAVAARPLPTLFLAGIAMLAFAGNSVLCRLALVNTGIDAASFTVLRIVSGAIVLWLLVGLRKRARPASGNWAGALALTLYAAAFSFAYIQLDTGTGALLLFGAVQLSMLAFGLVRGERLSTAATAGLVLATVGVLVLLLPGSTAPPLGSALIMLLSGLAWGAYSLLGRGAVDPLAETADNFLRSIPLVLLLALPFVGQIRWDATGALYAILSGAITSGLGYAIWYSALRGLGAMQAASLQLSVPILAAIAGVLLLSEPLSVRMLIAAVAVIGGLAIVLKARASKIRT
ncbi:DMT family transporter [uncultured Halopseudomonas sp.]|uniref:DMT family transporter n=1 Tax=uncultured Halopseudomonas sp. TaxID=2901193 RepID=UPI0030EDB6FF|tara:strand:+ start:24585 stop:25451 length:867 start_codon:yes stop_codon:yes gene_type:complete